MHKTDKFKLAICASASAYTRIIELSYQIEELGIAVVLPRTAEKMKRQGRQNNEVIIDWSKSSSGYRHKAELMRTHFSEIAKCDAVLVANYEKHGIQNYIGPNVLMEMGVGFYLNKPIYILNDSPLDSPLLDEILGLEPVLLKGDIGGLSKKL